MCATFNDLPSNISTTCILEIAAFFLSTRLKEKQVNKLKLEIPDEKTVKCINAEGLRMNEIKERKYREKNGERKSRSKGT